MQDILKYEEKKPLSFALMKKFAPPWCTVRLYDGLSKYSSLKAAAGSKPCMIVLYELHERDETAVGHYSLVLLGPKPRYWSSYGFPVDYEVSVTHSEDTLKDLMGDTSTTKCRIRRKNTHRRAGSGVSYAQLFTKCPRHASRSSFTSNLRI